MNEKQESSFLFFRGLLRWWKNVRDKFARALDVDEDRKVAIYTDLARSATLKDILYWLQIFFSAGIATLGLVLNSSAVIIGAMLISPLMGPILANGLALATGDLILAIRSLANLLLSSFGAILFALLLVTLLPFNEASAEIKSRVSPNTLDLGIALFSGAVGSVAICREVRGVVTSIPGVAIAVALMPPLCVVGFGFGLTFSLGTLEALKFSMGGGLLYLTNLVAIIFTAMLVFILLRIDTPKVRERVREWRETDPESLWWRNAVSKVPRLERAREIRSMPLRLLMILIPLLLIFIPLSQSYNQMKVQIQQQRIENELYKSAKETWDDYLKEKGRTSEFEELKVNENSENGKLEVDLKVIDDKPFTSDERLEYLTRLGKKLDRRNDSMTLNLVALRTSARDSIQPKVAETPVPPTIAELQAQFMQRVQDSMAGLSMPSSASMLNYKIINSAGNDPSIQLFYLSDKEITPDARELLTTEIKRRLALPNLNINFERIPTETEKITFENNGTKISDDNAEKLGEIVRNLQVDPNLKLEIDLDQSSSEVLLKEKEKAIREYLAQNWSIPAERINFVKSENEDSGDFYHIILPKQQESN